MSEPERTAHREADRRAGLLDLRRERAAHVGVVDDSGVEHVQRGDPGDVRFDLAEPLGPDHLGAHAVGGAAPLQLGQPVRGRRRRAATTTFPHTAWSMPCSRQYSTIETRPAEHSRAFVRTRRVVDAGVDHARVAAALVRADRRLLLHHHDRSLGMPADDRPRRGQPHDPAAYDQHVDPFHPTARYSVAIRATPPNGV